MTPSQLVSRLYRESSNHNCWSEVFHLSILRPKANIRSLGLAQGKYSYRRFENTWECTFYIDGTYAWIWRKMFPRKHQKSTFCIRTSCFYIFPLTSRMIELFIKSIKLNRALKSFQGWKASSLCYLKELWAWSGWRSLSHHQHPNTEL